MTSVRKATLTLARVDDPADTCVVHMAVHPSTDEDGKSYTVVPPVFTLTGELLFERHARLTRGALGAPAVELHGAQLLRQGDRVHVFTTPVDERKEALVAAVCTNLDEAIEDFPRWCVPLVDDARTTPLTPCCAAGRDSLVVMWAFSTSSVAARCEAKPSRMDVFHACMSFTIVHRQPSTVVMYFYSPTKTGVP